MSETLTRMDYIHEDFKKLNIEKIVYVDDFLPEIEVEEVITSEKRDEIFKSYFSELMIGDSDIENNNLREKWGDLKYETKISIKQFIQSVESDHANIDVKAIPAFFELLPPEKCITMSPDKWKQDKQKLLIDCRTTLFLFDQDLGISDRKLDGIGIIKEITENNDVLCGLFTKMTDKNGCLNYRKQMGDEYSIPEDKFFVIPKQDVIDNPILFIYLLKLTILSKHLFSFKEQIKYVINIASEKADERINEIHIEDLEHILFKTPFKEGMSESDMFYRIYSGLLRREFNDIAFSNNEIHNAIFEIRSLNNIKTEGISFLVKSNTWAIQHDELYDSAEHINKNYLPIEVGDIFQEIKENGKNKTYILLQQPCDLMLRSNGKRDREPKRFTLVKIRQGTRNDKGEINKSNLEQEVWFFSKSKEEAWIVNFKDIYFVKDCILDLCVYQEDGESKISSFDDFTSNNKIRPSLTNRYQRIKKYTNIGISKGKIIVDKINNNNKEYDSIKNSIYEAIFNDNLFKATYVEKENGYTLSYNCKRIGRLGSERAVGLLTEFYSVMSRPAYPPGYGLQK